MGMSQCLPSCIDHACLITSNGSAGSAQRPDPAAQRAFEVKKLTHGPRYCKTCHEYKPPRAHHCRKCKKCVVSGQSLRYNLRLVLIAKVLLQLKMDHHCPWIANCELSCRSLPSSLFTRIDLLVGVGFRNQGHFLRFLVWVDFGMASHMVIILSRMRAFATWSSVSALLSPFKDMLTIRLVF